MRFKFIFLNKYIYIRIRDFELIIVVFYVDDSFIFIKIEVIMNVIKNNIKIIFKIKNFGSINKILDI